VFCRKRIHYFWHVAIDNAIQVGNIPRRFLTFYKLPLGSVNVFFSRGCVCVCVCVCVCMCVCVEGLIEALSKICCT
jgi:hypothetical protein